MLVRNLLSLINGVTRVVAAAPGPVDLRRHLMIPDDVPFSADVADATPGTLLVGLIGPQEGTHTPPAELAKTLAEVPAGVTVLILAGWPSTSFPDGVVLETLADGHCQLTDAVTLTSTGRYGLHVALLAERVDAVQPRRTHLSTVPEAEPPALPVAALPIQLWLVNQPVLDERIVNPLRRQVRALTDRVTQQAAELTAARAETTEARAELKARGKELARSRKRVAALEESVSFRLGKTLVDGARNPGRGVVEVPKTVASLWRDRRARVSSVPERRPAPATATAPAGVSAPATAPVEAAQREVPIPVPGSPGRAVTMTAPSSLMVPRKLDEDGLAGYEPSSIPCFLAAIAAAGPGAVLDIGANVGLYAALAAAVSDRDVVAFEPFPTLAEVAERLTTDNDLKIQVERIALSDHNGTAAFYLSDSSDSSNSLAAGFRDSTRQIDVEVETLDAYVRRTGIVPAVLKIDTESTEPDVLLGAAETLREHRPWVLCEVLHRRGEDRLMEAMAPHGYRWYHITEQLPYAEAQTIAGDRTYQDLMWLFAPEAPDEAFWAAVGAQRAAVEATAVS